MFSNKSGRQPLCCCKVAAASLRLWFLKTMGRDPKMGHRPTSGGGSLIYESIAIYFHELGS